jgi:hypothetical protein
MECRVGPVLLGSSYSAPRLEIGQWGIPKVPAPSVPVSAWTGETGVLRDTSPSSVYDRKQIISSGALEMDKDTFDNHRNCNDDLQMPKRLLAEFAWG